MNAGRSKVHLLLERMRSGFFGGGKEKKREEKNYHLSYPNPNPASTSIFHETASEHEVNKIPLLRIIKYYGETIKTIPRVANGQITTLQDEEHGH